MAEDAGQKPGAEAKKEPPDPQERAAQHRNEAIRLLEVSAKHAKIAHERAPRLGRKKTQLTKSTFTYYAMGAEIASKMKQTIKATDLYKQAAKEAVMLGDHDNASTYLVRAAEELRTDKQGRRKQEVPRLYAQAAEEAVHASHVKDAIRYFQQAIEVAVAIGDLSSAKAMEERVAILKARIGFVEK